MSFLLPDLTTQQSARTPNAEATAITELGFWRRPCRILSALFSLMVPLIRLRLAATRQLSIMGTIEMEQDRIAALRDFLSAQSPGPIKEARRVPDLLSDCWSAFSGSGETNMAIDKLCRLEEPMWEPPCLSFLIERHGQTVNGSSRGHGLQMAAGHSDPHGLDHRV